VETSLVCFRDRAAVIILFFLRRLSREKPEAVPVELLREFALVRAARPHRPPGVITPELINELIARNRPTSAPLARLGDHQQTILISCHGFAAPNPLPIPASPRCPPLDYSKFSRQKKLAVFS